MKPDGGDLLDSVTPAITPTRATNAVDVPITNGDDKVFFWGHRTFASATAGRSMGWQRNRPASSPNWSTTQPGRVLGNQITPVYAVLDGKTHMADVPMEMIAFEAEPGAKLTLQLVASTVSYSVPQMRWPDRFLED